MPPAAAGAGGAAAAAAGGMAAGGAAAGGAAAGGMSFATFASIASLASGGMSAFSLLQQGESDSQISEYNTALALREAETIKEASEYEEREGRIRGRKLQARQLLQFAKSGVVPGTGTPLLVAGQTAADTEKNIALQKYEYGLRHSRSMSQAKLYKMMGKSKSRASRWQAGSSLLTGAYRASSISPFGTTPKTTPTAEATF